LKPPPSTQATPYPSQPSIRNFCSPSPLRKPSEDAASVEAAEVSDQLCYVDPHCDDLNPEVTLSTGPASTNSCTYSPSKTASSVTTTSTAHPSRGTAKKVSFNSRLKGAASDDLDDPDYSPISKHTRRRSQPPASGRSTSPHTTCKEKISQLEADNKQLFSIIAEMKKNQDMMDLRLQSQEEDGVDLQTLVGQIRGVEERVSRRTTSHTCQIRERREDPKPPQCSL